MTRQLAPPAPPDVGPRLPVARGDLTVWLLDVLRGKRGAGSEPPFVRDHALGDEDHALALYVLYELHYRGFAGVDEGLEWNLALLRLRAGLEHHFLETVRAEVGPIVMGDDVPSALRALFAGDEDVPSLAQWCDERGEHVHLREQAVHRSAYQLKEADPHSWALPRLFGAPKAALATIQYDEYGGGVERDMHASLFGLHLDRLGLDAGYGAHLDLIPGSTLATSNLVSLFGLHRRWRGALVGHLALFEMASVPVMAAYSSALRRLGYDSWTRLFYDAHVTADAQHQTIAAEQLAGGLAIQQPELAEDILFGARALGCLERLVTAKTLAAWTLGESSLLGPLATPDVVPGLEEDRGPADDPRLDDH